jgi:hypothetical protein
MENSVVPGAVPVIVGEQVAGEAAKVRKQLVQLIKSVNTSNFDIMDLLHEIKTKKFYAPKFDTFIDYARSLENFKVSKAYYLVRIKENMMLANIPREVYEPIGMTKLRTIAQIDVVDSENKIKQDAIETVKQIVQSAPTDSAEEVKAKVDAALGNVGDDAWEWLNLRVRKASKDNIRKMLDTIKMQLSQKKGPDGNMVDASDGAALDALALDWLADPNNSPLLEQLGESNELVELAETQIEHDSGSTESDYTG